MSDRRTPNEDGLIVVRDRPLHIMLAIDSAYPGIILGLESLARKIQRSESSCHVGLFDRDLLTRRTSARRILLFCPRRRPRP
jgi:hypothetical protein